MAKSFLKIQRALALALAVTMVLAAPVATYAKDGKKHFKEGRKFAENMQWDKAAEKFALAVAEKPSNIEYRLHLQRSLVQAGLMLVERGDRLVEQKDYNAAYQAYRQAYSFDPTNEVALIKMRRMLEAQGLPVDSVPRPGDPAGPAYKPKENGTNLKAGYVKSVNGTLVPANPKVQLPGLPARRFPKTDVVFRSDSLLSAIEQLAQAMGLNVIFDQQVANQMRTAKLVLELRNVTKPKALEMILKTNNLMYAQIDSRTIVIAMDNPQARMRYEPYSVRTFYIKNGDINELRTAITSTLQTKQIVPIKQLNALMVRDTPVNLELISEMIDTLDKSKAEVLIDVNIYEVSRNDLLQLGNQFTASSDDNNPLSASFLGGINTQDSILGIGARTLKGPLGFALGLPGSAISFFQDRGKAKLLASTQVHVVDNEQHQIRIGQRVPIQTATLPSFGTPTRQQQRQAERQTGLDQTDLSFGLGGSFGLGIPQIQYENVGLNIDMKPQVFEDEVQVTMKVESTSVDTSTGKLTPSFNQRTMNSVARIKDGQPTLIAGVSQTVESKTVRGFPLIGLIPILGRFFATPDTTDRQSDVVITVTPHILRRADITERDHLARESGTQSDPTNQLTLEQILYIADVEDAQQGQVATNGAPPEPFKTTPATQPESRPAVNIPTSAPPGVVVAPVPTTASPPAQRQSLVQPEVQRETVSAPGAVQKREIDDDDDDDDDDGPTGLNSNPVMVSVKSASAVATKGQDLYVAVIVNGPAEISSSYISLSYDPNILEVKGVRDGGLLRVGGANPELQFTAESGQLNIQMTRPNGSPGVPARGQLLIIVFTVKGQGQSPLTLNEGTTMLKTPSGQNLTLKLDSTQVEVR